MEPVWSKLHTLPTDTGFPPFLNHPYTSDQYVHGFEYHSGCVMSSHTSDKSSIPRYLARPAAAITSSICHEIRSATTTLNAQPTDCYRGL